MSKCKYCNYERSTSTYACCEEYALFMQKYLSDIVPRRLAMRKAEKRAERIVLEKHRGEIELYTAYLFGKYYDEEIARGDY